MSLGIAGVLLHESPVQVQGLPVTLLIETPHGEVIDGRLVIGIHRQGALVLGQRILRPSNFRYGVTLQHKTGGRSARVRVQ